MTEPLLSQLTAALAAKNLHPQAQWLASLVSTAQHKNLTALTSTATFRILASDITATLSPDNGAGCFPADVQDAEVKERTFGESITVQILDVEDIGASRWSQVEAIEALERGEGTRGREIIRVGNEDEDGDSGEGGGVGGKAGKGPHKLLLQDCRGTLARAFELDRIDGIGLEMGVGAKLLLARGTVVARGMVLLGPGMTTILGGRVEAWQKAWIEKRKERLKERIDRARDEDGTGSS